MYDVPKYVCKVQVLRPYRAVSNIDQTISIKPSNINSYVCEAQMLNNGQGRGCKMLCEAVSQRVLGRGLKHLKSIA
jgi:hypothetical protein